MLRSIIFYSTQSFLSCCQLFCYSELIHFLRCSAIFTKLGYFTTVLVHFTTELSHFLEWLVRVHVCGGGNAARSETRGSVGMARGSVHWTRAFEPCGSERAGLSMQGARGCATSSVGAWTVGYRWWTLNPPTTTCPLLPRPQPRRHPRCIAPHFLLPSMMVVTALRRRPPPQTRHCRAPRPLPGNIHATHCRHYWASPWSGQARPTWRGLHG
jgi:hypothetical protein